MKNSSSAPHDVEAFQARLIEVTERLPKKLRQCADYIAAHSDKIAVSTVSELAEGAGVQPSAFIRFCQVMGFSGYSELQRIFRNRHAQQWPDYATRLKNLKENGDNSPSALLAEFVEAGRISLENLVNQVDPEDLSRAVLALSGASVIHVIGMSRAYPVASYLSYAFEKMSIPAILHDKVGNIDHRHAIRPGDVLLTISFAPYTKTTVDLLHFAKNQGNQVVSITDSINSPFHQAGATVLRVSEVDVGAFRALAATLSLATSLAVAVGAKRKYAINRK